MKKISKITVASMIVFGLVVSPALAKNGIKAGVLDCDVSAGVGMIIGSSKSVNCTFKTGDGRVEHYSGKLGKLGLDIGATEYVHQRLIDQRAEGTAIMLISEDLDEILALSDRILVIYEGEIMGEVITQQATPESLGLLMAGVRAGSGDLSQ